MADMEGYAEAKGVVLATLYEAYPRLISLRNSTLDIEQDEQTLRLYCDTIIGLEKDGYIHYGARSSGDPIYFEDVGLTQKGRDVLSSVPDALENTTLGDRLLAALQSGSREALKATVQAIISVAIARGVG
jgi:hypothetical protein